MLKKLLIPLLILVGLGGMNVFAADSKLTDTEKDGYYLFAYPYQDAVSLKGQPSKTIIVKKEGPSVKYVFADHVLSCGTHMFGYILETKAEGKSLIKGSFTASNNPYKIEQLGIDLTKDLKTGKFQGTITVDGKKIDWQLVVP